MNKYPPSHRRNDKPHSRTELSKHPRYNFLPLWDFQAIILCFFSSSAPTHLYLLCSVEPIVHFYNISFTNTFNSLRYSQPTAFLACAPGQVNQTWGKITYQVFRDGRHGGGWKRACRQSSHESHERGQYSDLSQHQLLPGLLPYCCL